ncbi:MAG: anti-sigma factor family protein [Gemmatimonadaceae bacterium]
MDCRTFHARHVGFVDDVLPGIEIVEMQRHIAECTPCARHDARIRRSLLVFRNMPTIQCSPGFTERVNDRVRALGHAPQVGPTSFLTPATFAAMIAAGLVLFGGVNLLSDTDAPLSHAPVVAMIPAQEELAVEQSLMASHAMLASVSTGIPIWPAALMAEQAQIQFANSAFRLTSLTR